jgi:ABC-type transport system substrate-binding protein
MDAPGPDAFRIFLREPCGFVLEALGKPSSNVPFIMPKRVAETDAFKQIDDYIGSGPYVFKRDEFKPGALAVYLKNSRYVPRRKRLPERRAASASMSIASNGCSRRAIRRRRSTRCKRARST